MLLTPQRSFKFMSNYLYTPIKTHCFSKEEISTVKFSKFLKKYNNNHKNFKLMNWLSFISLR